MKKNIFSYVIGIVLPLCFCGFAGATAAEPQQIALFGDSITHAGWQTEWMQYFLATRYPQRPVYVANCGIGGATAASSRKRLKWDLLDLKPNIVYIMLGMNDIGHGLYAEEPPPAENAAQRQAMLNSYEKEMAALLKELDPEPVAVFLITPSPYDQYGNEDTPRLKHPNDALAQCAVIMRRLARNHRAGVVELHGPMTKWLQDHPGKQLAGADRIHPPPVSNWFIAMQMLQEYAGMVAELELSAVGAVLRQEYCKVTEMELSGNHMRFRYQPRALPLAPTAELTEFAALVPDFTVRFNTERFSVSLLPDGNYELRGDGEVFGSFSAAELARGINLAQCHTPSVRQSFEVDALVRELHELHSQLRSIAYTRHVMALYGVADPTAVDAADQFFPDFIAGQDDESTRNSFQSLYDAYRRNAPRQAEMEARREALWAGIFAAAQPRSWIFELRPAQ